MSSLIVNANYNQVKKIDYNPSKSSCRILIETTMQRG